MIPLFALLTIPALYAIFLGHPLSYGTPFLDTFLIPDQFQDSVFTFIPASRFSHIKIILHYIRRKRKKVINC